MQKSIKNCTFTGIIVCVVVSGALLSCAPKRDTTPQPKPRERTEDPSLALGHAKMVLYALYSLKIIEDERWPEGDVKGRVLFDEAVALHEKEDYAAAAGRFLQAAASFASVPETSPFAPTILKNRDLACANARVAFINGGLEVEMAKTAETLENMDPACARQLKR